MEVDGRQLEHRGWSSAGGAGADAWSWTDADGDAYVLLRVGDG